MPSTVIFKMKLIIKKAAIDMTLNHKVKCCLIYYMTNKMTLFFRSLAQACAL